MYLKQLDPSSVLQQINTNKQKCTVYYSQMWIFLTRVLNHKKAECPMINKIKSIQSSSSFVDKPAF